MTLADIGLAAVVAVVALVPAALAFMALGALLQALRVEERLGAVAFRALAGGFAAAVAAAAVLGAWTWGGATHLQPRCLARADPVYAGLVGLADMGGADGAPGRVPVTSVLVDAPASGAAPPAWAAALVGGRGFDHYEWRRPDGKVFRVDAGGALAPVPATTAGAVLRVRRASTQSGYWLRITVDSFTLAERRTQTVLARGEEMWVDAGPARYRCGVASGPRPVAGRDYPPGDGVARFVLGAVEPER